MYTHPLGPDVPDYAHPLRRGRRAALDRLDDVARDLRHVEPLVGHFLIAAVGMTRSGEMSPRQLAHATLSIAGRLGDDLAAFRDQLRGVVPLLLDGVL